MKSLPNGRSSLPRIDVGFTLVELLVSVSLLGFLMIILATITDSASRAWCEGRSRTDTFQSARASLDLLARELAPAVVDTRMQFVVAPAAILSAAPISLTNVASASPVVLWMAPLCSEGSLCCVGYYLYRDDVNRFYRLKRIYITPTDSSGNTSAYFPQTVDFKTPRDTTLQPNPIDASWFTRNWDNYTLDDQDANNSKAVASSAADGVIAFWVQCLDSLGNPIPYVSQSSIHPKSSLYFNSAAYFQVATTAPFDDGTSFEYLAKTAQSLKANRVPAAVELTVMLLDSATITRGVSIPQQVNDFDANGALDVTASVNDYTKDLNQNGVYSARTFSTRVKLVNGN